MNPQMVMLLAAEPTGRVFGLDQQTLVQIAIQLFNTGVLAALLTFVLYKPVRAFLKKRTDKISGQLTRAKDDMARAHELKTEYEQKLTDIEQERSEILTEAHKLAAEKGKQLVEEAKREAATLKERAAHEIDMERERAKDEMKQAIIEVSAAMAGKFVVQTIDADVQSRLFDETMTELEEATWQS